MSRNSQSKPTALIVEDSEPLAKVLRLALRSAGFDTHEAAEGARALRVLNQERIDAVVLDLELKDGLGGTVLARLRDPESSDGPVWVTISGLERDQAIGRYGPVGVHFLVKPFDLWGLVRLLREDLEQKGQVTQA